MLSSLSSQLTSNPSSMANSLITIKGLTNDQLPNVQAKLQAYIDTIWPEAKVEVDATEEDEIEEDEDDEEEPKS